MVAKGLGHTVLPKSAMARELREGSFAWCPIVDPVLTQPVSIGATRDCRVPRLVERTDIILRHALADLVAEGVWPGSLLFEPDAT